MASIISQLSGAVESVSALANLAFGASGGVVLDQFTFGGMEVPEYISLGASMGMHVHKLVGGERVIDTLGADPSDISWSGLFIDGDPYGRVQELEQLHSAGNPLGLQWGPFFYTVVIHSFSSKTLYGRASYQISCTVLRNEATASAGSDPSLTSAIGSDISSALGISPATLTATMTGAQTAVAALGRLVPGSPSLAIASGQIASIGGSLTAISGLPIGTISGAASLSSVTSQSGILASAQQSFGYIGRAIRNLT